MNEVANAYTNFFSDQNAIIYGAWNTRRFATEHYTTAVHRLATNT